MRKKHNFVFSVIMLVISAAIIVGVLLLSDSPVDTPAVVLPTGAAEKDDGRAEKNDPVSVTEVNAENVQAVIATLKRVSSYSRDVKIITGWSGGKSHEELSIKAKDGSFLIHSAESGKYVLLTSDNKLYIWYEGAGSCHSGTAAGSADEWMRCVTYEEILEADPADILFADYVDYNSEGCIKAEYRSGSFGYRNIIYVSVNTGLLMGAETLDGDKIIYGMTSGDISLSAPDDSYFVPPEEADAK